MAEKTDSAPMSGAIPYAIGQASVVRIPIPGTDGLCIEFRPRGHVPKTGSTSTLFFQDATGRRHLRLDYGYNPRTKTIDFHWNQQRVFADFGIADHTSLGPAARLGYYGAKSFRYAGRVLLIVGVAVDIASIVQSDRPLRRASQVVSAWALSWAGCEAVGAGGAEVGAFGGPWGIATGGVGGCIIGGVGGYFGGEALGGQVYDWAAETTFAPLVPVPPPLPGP